MEESVNNIQRRNREVYEVFKLLRSRRSHTSDYVTSWIEANYFISQDTVYRILRGVYGDMSDPFDAATASCIYHAAISEQYMQHGAKQVTIS